MKLLVHVGMITDDRGEDMLWERRYLVSQGVFHVSGLSGPCIEFSRAVVFTVACINDTYVCPYLAS